MIIIPNSVRKNGWNAFNNCSKLKSITRSDSINKN